MKKLTVEEYKDFLLEYYHPKDQIWKNQRLGQYFVNKFFHPDDPCPSLFYVTDSNVATDIILSGYVEVNSA